ncbi:cell division protein FtsX [Tamilnaduibacter salinus]|uniref:Cell division protein FtsX n=1 Tax=Tamilnaduibacter salinus TaxID=1484056 RepID=A0A2U1CYR6_9GAMM|nr:permease-like cell division protein FtsX [Tamilnaduibacter salinus]PVY77645.1 cell division protein FtsX [Tamilnaduibacter salinus]
MATESQRDAGPRRGAARQKTAWRVLLDSYVAHHRKTARQSFQRLIAQPLTSGMTWLVMGIALALPMGLLLLLSSLQGVSAGWESTARVTLYLEQSADQAQLQALAAKVGSRPDVSDVAVIPRDEALAEFRASSGLSDALDYLESNPLPHTVMATPAEPVRTPEGVEALVGELRQLEAVAQVQVDLGWLQRLSTMTELLGRVVWTLALLLAVALVLVIGNTIRLAIESRRDEILVSKLVGGTNAFVRRPFLYTGVWYGLGGGLCAWILLVVSFWWLSGPVGRLASLYRSDFVLAGLSFADGLLMLVFSALLGWLGAWVAVKRHLDAIEPSQIDSA